MCIFGTGLDALSFYTYSLTDETDGTDRVSKQLGSLT